MERKIDRLSIIEQLSFVAIGVAGVVAIVTALAGCDAAPRDAQEAESAPEGMLGAFGAELDQHNAPGLPAVSEPEPEPESPGWCDDVEFPPANEPDGCSRRLVTQDGQGNPFNASSTEAGISRNGKLVVFTVLPTEEFGVNGLPADTNLFRDVYAARIGADSAPLELISVNADGQVGDGDSFEPSVDPSGDYVAFTSYAKNLSADDTGGHSAVFLRDRVYGKIVLVSASNHGNVPDGDSYSPVVSANGQFVAFLSAASNLVFGDSNDRVDLFVRDLQRGVTQRVSLTNGRQEANDDSGAAVGISDDGRYVLFTHPSRLSADDRGSESQPAQDRMDVYRVDRTTGRALLISRPGGEGNVQGATAISLSADGRRALFGVADPGALIGGDDWGHRPATIVGQVQDDGVELSLVKIGDGRATGMSESGHVVAFASRSLDLVGSVDKVSEGLATANAYAYDRDTTEVRLLTSAENGTPAVLHDYDEAGVAEGDWVEVAVSGSGKRFVMSSIQYGIVQNSALHCARFRPRMIYLVDCGQ